jgi:hypothetical protein
MVVLRQSCRHGVIVVTAPMSGTYGEGHRQETRSMSCGALPMVSSARVVRSLTAAVALAAGAVFGASAEAQVVYYSTLRPVMAAPVMAVPVAPMVTQSTYVANYTPAGNYAAVTAFSPPVTVPTSSVAVTSYYAPTYAPPATVAYYAPAAVAAPVAAPMVMAEPVTAYYAPVPVMGQLYRRGPLGVYRPVRSAYMIGY